MPTAETGLHVLLVEDNPAHARLVMLPLSRRGVKVDWAPDGEAAVNWLTAPGGAHGASLVLLDLRMPGLNGFEVLDRVRHQGNVQHIPVIILSTSAEISDIQEAYRLGANAYLVKPTDFDELDKAVESIVNFWLLHNRTTTKSNETRN